MKKLVSVLLSLAIMAGLCAAMPLSAAAEDRDAVFAEAVARLFPAEGSRAPDAALELLLPLAESGDAEAQYYCGWIYDFELEENMETELEAYNWYEKAMEGGILKAYVGAALNSFAESPQKSDELLNHAFSEGFLEMSDDELGADGLFWIGFIHELGFGLEQDEEEALNYYTKAAEKNSVLSMVNAATLLDGYYMVSPKGKLCIALYEKAAARNYAPAMYSLGLKHYFNYYEGVESGIQFAFDWFGKAAGLGHAESMYMLGSMYQSGEGTEIDLPLAFEWYSKAVELGNTDAMCMLGHMYRDGSYVAQNYDTAMDCFIDAAVLGNYSASLVVDMMKTANQGMNTYRERESEFLAALAQFE